MPEVVFGELPVIVFGLVATVATALYIREYSSRKKIEQSSKATPQDQANYLSINELTQKSNELVTQATGNAEKLASEAKFFDEKTTQDFSQKMAGFLEQEEAQTKQAESEIVAEFKSEETKFDQFLKDLTKVLDSKTEHSVSTFNAYLENLKEESKKTQAANWEGEKARVAQLFENFETKLADFLLQTEQKMILSVDLELRSARQLIDTYKVQQMNIIDENITAMLEKTLSLVLAKNLSLKDQMDFVYECLEKAKAEKFLV